MNLKIFGLNLGFITNLYHAENTLQQNFDKGRIYVCSPTWVILGGEKKILVDTGYPSVEWFNNHIPKSMSGSFWQRAERKPDQELIPALGKIDLKPEDIDIVINTHLHFDHCGQNDKFKNSKFIVQRKEYINAFRPFTGFEWAYASPLAFPGEMPPFWGTNFTFIEGDTKIIDGVKCITIPGHSPGEQGILVDTAKGKYFLAGDLFPTTENWERKIPTGYISDLNEWYRSYDKVLTLNAKVIAHHCATNFEGVDVRELG